MGKKVNGVLVQGFLWEDSLRPAVELDGSGNVVSHFAYGTRSNVPEYLVRGGQTYRLLTDHLGSARLLINTSDGTVAQRMEYDEFGRILVDTNPGFQPFGFAGGLYDSDAALVRLGARDYDPVVGRWAARDPQYFSTGDANLFVYAINDPINLSDVNGRDVWSAAGNFGAGVATGVVGTAVVGVAVASGSAVGAAVAVAATAYGGFELGQALYELAAGVDWGSGDPLTWEDRADLLAGLLGSAAGGGLFCEAGPSGPLFGRGRYRGGASGLFNRGNDLRFGWSWNGAAGRNEFGFHGGSPNGAGHWHFTPVPGPQGPVEIGPVRW